MIHGMTTSPLALTRLSTLLVASLTGLHAIAAPTSSQEATPSDDAVRTKFSFEGGTASQLFTQLAEPFPDFPVVLGGMAGDFEISGFEAIITEPRTIVELV